MIDVWCQWASCRKAGPYHADGWDFCKLHLFEHRLMMRDQSATQKHLTAVENEEQIRGLHAEGLSDKEMAATIGLDPSRVSHYRRRLNLPANVKPRVHVDVEPCGTRAAYRRHLRRKEPPCEACSRAEVRLRREYYERNAR